MISIRRPVLFAAALVLVLGTVGCSSGRSYDYGFVQHERVHYGLFDFGRDETRVHWSLLHEKAFASGCTWSGVQYFNIINGLLMTVNIPGISWLITYPFQASDVPESRFETFGIGSGEGDVRISFLWGMISLGRNWNLFWMNGFWMGSDDPVFVAPPEEVFEEFAEYAVVKVEEEEDET